MRNRFINKILLRVFGIKIYNYCRNIVLKSKMRTKLNRRFKEELGSVSARVEFYSTFLKRNDLCFDVGANIGNRITPLLEIGSKVIAIEPQKVCVKFLKNKFGEKITIVDQGVGEKEEIKDFHISNSTTISTFSEEWIQDVQNGRFKGYEWNKVQKVKITTLDKLIENYGIPRFVKIDVEGFELEVLKGLSSSINMISYEYTVPEQTQKAISCLKQIEKINPKGVCNFSVGESMKFYLDKWKPVKEMIEFLNTDEFCKTGFGDIYVKQPTEL